MRAPLLKIAFRPVRQEHPPCFLELGARLVEGRGRAVGLLSRITTLRIVRPRPRRGRVPRPPQLQICFRTLVLGRRGQFSDRIALKREKSCV